MGMRIKLATAAAGIAALAMVAMGCSSEDGDVSPADPGQQVDPVSSVGDGGPPGQAGPAVMGSPPAPDQRLTFDAVLYTAVGIHGATSSSGGASPIVCCGATIGIDDMTVVGTATRHNPDGDSEIQVYRPKAGEGAEVYTLHGLNEDGSEEGTAPETWTRWAAK